MSWTNLAHVVLGDLATPALQNALIDNQTLLKTYVNANGMPVTLGLIGASANYSIVPGTDQLVIGFNTLTMTLPAASTAGLGRWVTVKQIGPGIITMAGTGAGTIDYVLAATANVRLYPGDSLTFTADGSLNWFIS